MTIRTLQVTDLKKNAVIHKVKHIHYHAWEDFSTPANSAMQDLMNILQAQADMLTAEVEKLHKKETANPQKILIHCLAGRGRTGTAIAIIKALMTLQWQIMNLDQAQLGVKITAANVRDYLKLSVFSIVRRVREQRGTAVQASS